MNFVMNKNERAITLIALVITIIVIMILAGTSISMIMGQNGVISNSIQAKMKNELAEYKEQYNLFLIDKKMENSEFDEETLFAGKDTLRYNTQKDGETGTIKDICPKISNDWIDKFEIRKGNIIIDTKDKAEIKVAQGLGIEVNPYEITEDGELTASDGNLMLVDANGTLTLPENIKIIGEGTFADTQSDGVFLKKVVIPYTVTEIKANAFNGNSTIEEIEIQNKNGKGVTKIGEYAFANCSNLKSIVIPDSVTKIGKDTFFNCYSLKDVKLSKNIKEISYQMFYVCTSLEEIVIPDNVTTIFAGAFSTCSNLRIITLPTSLTTIEDNSFRGSKKINQFNLNKNVNFIFENGILMNKEKTAIHYITEDSMNQEVFDVPDGIISLRPGMLTSDVIKKVRIPASVTSIENDFFPNSLKEIEIDSENENFIVNNGGIYNKEKTILYFYFKNEDVINLDEGIIEIGEKALRKTKATTINLPNSVKKIDGYAFGTYVKNINVEENVEDINYTAFIVCDTNINLNKNNKKYTVENGILYNKEKTNLIVCVKNIESIKIPEGVVTIGSQAFGSRKYMKNITLPSTLNSIGDSAFSGCKGLTEITIPSSVTEIGQNCFRETDNLKHIKINKAENSISGAPWGNRYGTRAIEWQK